MPATTCLRLTVRDVVRVEADMDAGFEVTDPRRALLVGGALGGSLLVGAAAVVALLVVPLLGRVDRTLETLNASLPILEQVGPDVQTLRGDVGEIAPDVDTLEGTVQDVEQGLGTIDDSIGGLRPPLATVDDSVRGVDDSVQGVARRVGALDDSLRRMEASLGALDTLPSVLEELRTTTDGIATIADRTDVLVGQLGRVAMSLERMTALLEETEQHVENLDRKTGPVLVPGGGGSAD